MTEILWHGRGGQGAFTAAKLLGAAHIERQDTGTEKRQANRNTENTYAIAFPSFGPERRGAPVRAFTKLDYRPIGDRGEIEAADFVIILDETLYSERNFDELKLGGKIILNTQKTIEDGRVITVDANKIALEILKVPIVNTVMLGAFAGIYRDISLDQITQAIKKYMPFKLHEKNIRAVQKAILL